MLTSACRPCWGWWIEPEKTAPQLPLKRIYYTQQRVTESCTWKRVKITDLLNAAWTWHTQLALRITVEYKRGNVGVEKGDWSRIWTQERKTKVFVNIWDHISGTQLVPGFPKPTSDVTSPSHPPMELVLCLFVSWAFKYNILLFVFPTPFF